MRCTRTNDVFEAFQFPCDERAGGPRYDKGSTTEMIGEENRTYGTRTRHKGDICLEKANSVRYGSRHASEEHEPLSAVNWPSF